MLAGDARSPYMYDMNWYIDSHLRINGPTATQAITLKKGRLNHLLLPLVHESLDLHELQAFGHLARRKGVRTAVNAFVL